ncbi:DUF4442 domain-containing protein [Acinetobacter sp. c3-l95]|uniref:DUF4442 domain-containing protein n=1 Tax=Acinetobacter sp. c3-l95 TaxID=3342804 RepID=UPI0035BA2657
MMKDNRLFKMVKSSYILPKAMQRTFWTKLFGRIVPMVGTAKIRYIEVSPSQVVVKIDNHKDMQNHIKGVHAAATALLAETATGFVTGLNVPDDRILLIKSLHVDYVKVAKGALTATATLSDEQRAMIFNTEKGELAIPISVVDDSGKEPVKCEMIWAWRPKR